MERTTESIWIFLGKFIYLMDAYEDIEDDLKNHNYNPLKIYIQNRNLKI